MVFQTLTISHVLSFSNELLLIKFQNGNESGLVGQKLKSWLGHMAKIKRFHGLRPHNLESWFDVKHTLKDYFAYSLE
jgi:hypothetical protein